MVSIRVGRIILGTLEAKPPLYIDCLLKLMCGFVKHLQDLTFFSVFTWASFSKNYHNYRFNFTFDDPVKAKKQLLKLGLVADRSHD